MAPRVIEDGEVWESAKGLIQVNVEDGRYLIVLFTYTKFGTISYVGSFIHNTLEELCQYLDRCGAIKTEKVITLCRPSV